MTAGSRTPVTPGAVFRGWVTYLPEYPGVTIVKPWAPRGTAEACGRPVNAWGPAPIIVYTKGDPEHVVEAAVAYGERCGHKRLLRREAQAWLASADGQATREAYEHERQAQAAQRFHDAVTALRHMDGEENVLWRAMYCGFRAGLIDPADTPDFDAEPTRDAVMKVTREWLEAAGVLSAHEEATA